MTELYTTSPTVSFSLEEFNAFASTLYTAEGGDEAFVRFVLTGEYLDDDSSPKQAFIDPVRNYIAPDHPLTISRDYDSAIGLSSDILADGPITIFAVPHPTFALKKSIHMTYSIMYGGEEREAEFHHIPNFEFGNFGGRHKINIFFPKLWTPENSSDSESRLLSDEQRAAWYELGLRPAIERLVGPAFVSEWPATYHTERIRAEKARGGHSWATKVIPSHVVGLLMGEVNVQLLRQGPPLNWATDAFVMHTIRGVKGATYHHTDAISAPYYLQEMFDDAQLVYDAPDRGTWFVDVGIQVSCDLDNCVQWMTATHHAVVKQALRISDADAQRITQIGSSKYWRDLASHLTSVSGFRIEPGVQAAGEFEATYLQAYTTDKAVIYHPQGTHSAKFLTAAEALGHTQPAKTISGIHDIYSEARRANPSSARLEVRVPYQFATTALVEFDHTVLQNSLCLFTKEEWWNFRLLRLTALSQVLSVQQAGPTPNRFIIEALTLTAACIWLVNGLHARPEDGPAARTLMDAVLPITDAEGANRDIIAYNTSTRYHNPGDVGEHGLPTGSVPYNPYGCVFLRRIQFPQVPRFRYGGPVLNHSAFMFWFDKMSVLQLNNKFAALNVAERDPATGFRSTTNKTKLPLYFNFSGAPEPSLFNMSAQGHELNPIVIDDLSDVEDRQTPPPHHGSHDIDVRLSDLWRQFVSDLTSKSPNQRGQENPSYLKLNDEERRSANEDPYMNLNLPSVFHAVYYKEAPVARWQLCFDWLFPPLNRLVNPSTKTNIQNYRQSPYYNQWANLVTINKNKPELIEDIRAELFVRIRQWNWMPYAQYDKMWPTAAHRPCSRSFTRWPVVPGHPAAPHILLKEGAVPTFRLHANNREEEEEEEDIIDLTLD